MAKKVEIWYGCMPGLCGYGINVIGFSEAETTAKLKKYFYEYRKSWKFNEYTFKRALEYFGGYVKKLEPGKCYYDDFGE